MRSLWKVNMMLQTNELKRSWYMRQVVGLVGRIGWLAYRHDSSTHQNGCCTPAVVCVRFSGKQASPGVLLGWLMSCAAMSHVARLMTALLS